MSAHDKRPMEEPVTFDNPPVGEVALAVQFAQPATDDASTLGRFWPRIQNEYPQVQVQPSLPPMSEDFEAPTSLSFKFLDPSQRYWFLSENQAELVQVQPDRIAFNWRREPAGGEVVQDYPRYRHIRARFERTLRTFCEEMRAVGREPRATWCEVTYINPIAAAGGERPDLSAILRRIAPPPTDPLPPPEDTTFAERSYFAAGTSSLDASPLRRSPPSETPTRNRYIC